MHIIQQSPITFFLIYFKNNLLNWNLNTRAGLGRCSKMWAEIFSVAAILAHRVYMLVEVSSQPHSSHPWQLSDTSSHLFSHPLVLFSQITLLLFSRTGVYWAQQPLHRIQLLPADFCSVDSHQDCSLLYLHIQAPSVAGGLHSHYLTLGFCEFGCYLVKGQKWRMEIPWCAEPGTWIGPQWWV